MSREGQEGEPNSIDVWCPGCDAITTPTHRAACPWCDQDLRRDVLAAVRSQQTALEATTLFHLTEPKEIPA